RGFKREHALRRAGWIRPANQLKELLGISAVAVALSSEAVLQIVIAVWQAEATLVEIDGVGLGLFEVGIDEGVERRRIEAGRAFAHQAGNSCKIGSVADRIELGRDCARAEAIDRR